MYRAVRSGQVDRTVNLMRKHLDAMTRHHAKLRPSQSE
jgi:hypothetical protein